MRTSLAVARWTALAVLALWAFVTVGSVVSGEMLGRQLMMSAALLLGYNLPAIVAVAVVIFTTRRLKRGEHAAVGRPLMSDRAVLIGACVVLAGFALLLVFRYDTTAAGNGYAFKVDRLTGTVTFLAGGTERLVKPAP